MDHLPGLLIAIYPILAFLVFKNQALQQVLWLLKIKSNLRIFSDVMITDARTSKVFAKTARAESVSDAQSANIETIIS
jgi:hypothetical protein